MTLSEEQVEWIVREVLRRLGVPGDERSSPPAVELTISESLVTMRSLEGRLTGIKRLVVPQRAVVTPAVKDELKQRQIELVCKG